MFVNVVVNGIDVKMEVDTGTYVSIISKETKDRLFPFLKIVEAKYKLKAYGKIPLEHEGTLDKLQVQFAGKEATLTMTVMKRKGPTLISRQWLKVFGL